MKKFSAPALLVAAFLVTALLACSCGNNEQKQKHTSFETLTLVRKSVTLPTHYSAIVQGKNDVSIYPQTSGQLMKVCVSVGQKVKKGDVMFLIDNRDEINVVNAREADLMAAQAAQESARLEYESNRNLYEKEIVSSYVLQTSANDYERAKASVAQAKAALAQAELMLEFCTVKSPVDGLVGNIPNNPGDLVSIATLLTTVSGTEQMKVSFSLPEKLVQDIIGRKYSLEEAIKIAPPLTLTLKNGMEYEHKGKIARAAGNVDRATGAVIFESYFPNPDGKLYSGIQGTVTLEMDYDNVLIIPLTAVSRIQDKTLVFKVVDNCAQSTVVELEESTNGDYAAVLSGLEEGDTIVAKGINNVVDGMQVIYKEEE